MITITTAIAAVARMANVFEIVPMPTGSIATARGPRLLAIVDLDATIPKAIALDGQEIAIAAGCRLVATGAGTAVIVPETGPIRDLVIRKVSTPDGLHHLAEAIEGEIASGMTKAVEVDPASLLAVARSLVEAGAARCSIAAADRWGAVSVRATWPDGFAATITIASTDAAVVAPAAPPEPDSDDPLAFTIGGGRQARKAARPRQAATPRDYGPGELPF